MRLDGWFHRRLAWLALCAMIFGAFAPSISKLLVATQGISWSDVCSASGAKRVVVNLVFSETPEMPMAGDVHCGYCLLQHYSPVIPTTFYSWELSLMSTGRLLIGSGGTTVFKRFIRDAHRTRAPPVFF